MLICRLILNLRSFNMYEDEGTRNARTGGGSLRFANVLGNIGASVSISDLAGDIEDHEAQRSGLAEDDHDLIVNDPLSVGLEEDIQSLTQDR